MSSRGVGATGGVDATSGVDTTGELAGLGVTFGISLIFSLTVYFAAASLLGDLHPDAGGVILLYLYILLAPQVGVLGRSAGKVCAQYLGVVLGLGWLILTPGGGGGLFIAGSFVMLVIVLASTLAVISPKAVRVGAMVLSLLFLSSFLWTAEVLPRVGWTYLSVWLCPQAMISVAFKDFSFALLPDVYNVWLGPVCPLPASFWRAGLYYLIPALLLALLMYVSKRIWRNA